MSKTLSFYNLTGGLNSVQDLATINSTPNRTESPDMMNIEYYKLGGIQTMKGNTQIANTLSSKITCGFEYILGNKSYMIVTTENNYVWEYDKVSKSFTQLGRMLYDTSEEDIGQSATHPRHCIVGYNNGVVISNGYSLAYYNRILQQVIGADTRDYFFASKVPKLHPADNSLNEIEFYPNCIASYKGRLFVGANTTTQDENNYTGSTAFYSGVGLGIKITYNNDDEPEDIDVTWYEAGGNPDEDAGAFKEFFEDSSFFTGLGTWAEYLVIHKEQNTYLLDGTASLSDSWTLKPYSEYTVPSQQSYVVANNGYYTYIPEAGGIYPLLSRSIYNNTFQGGELSFKIKDNFDFLDNERFNEIYATYNPKRKQILFYMPMIDNTDNEGKFNGSGSCYIYDIQTKTWLYRKVPQYVTCAFKFENETYIGTKDGLVLQEFRGKTFNGKSIEFYYLTPPFIWGGGTNKTTTKEFRIKMLNSSANHFFIESFRDGNLSAKEHRLIKNVNDNLGGLIWDIDYRYGILKSGSSTVYTSLGDFNPDNFTYNELTQEYTIKPSITTMYQYTYDDTDYYTTALINDYSWNVPVYSQPEIKLEYFLGYNQSVDFYVKSAGTPSDFDLIEYTTAVSYAWIQKNPQQLCYKNGKYYAWVDIGDTSGTCITNLVSSTKQIWQGVQIDGAGDNPTVSNWRVEPDLLKSIRQAQANGQKNIYYPTSYPSKLQYRYNGSWVTTVSDGTVGIGTNIYSSLNGETWNFWGVVVTHGMSIPVNGNDTLKNVSLGTESATIETPSGTQPNGLTKSYTTSSSNIVINIEGVGNVTLSRYTAGDIGTVDGDIVYTEDDTPTANTDKVYINVDFSDSGTTITTVNDGSIVAGGITYYRYSQGDSNRIIPAYYKLTRKLSDDTYVDVVEATTSIYDYPVLDGLPKSLTDTVWDYSDATKHLGADLPTGYDSYDDIPTNLRGDAWLQQGYQTKRMLLPNQYFETIQFKFSGGGYDKDGNERDDDNICISGFEVDGIQLAETPWA